MGCVIICLEAWGAHLCSAHAVCTDTRCWTHNVLRWKHLLSSSVTTEVPRRNSPLPPLMRILDVLCMAKRRAGELLDP